MKVKGLKTISIVLLSLFVLVITSCGAKKPEQKVDHSKVDTAYEEYNKKNN